MEPPPPTLAQQIRATAESGVAVEAKLETSQRIIARVTDGIYREPWAAFRELIANAYDADATEVVIQTDAPTFRRYRSVTMETAWTQRL